MTTRERSKDKGIFGKVKKYGEELIADVIGKFEDLIAKLESGIADCQAEQDGIAVRVEELVLRDTDLCNAVSRGQTMAQKLRDLTDPDTVEQPALVRLRNGSEEAVVLVNTIMMVIRGLFDNGKFMIFYELVETCRDRDHKLFGESGKQLEELRLISLIEDGKAHVHESIRNIVLSCAEGEGMGLSIVDPREK